MAAKRAAKKAAAKRMAKKSAKRKHKKASKKAAKKAAKRAAKKTAKKDFATSDDATKEQKLFWDSDSDDDDSESNDDDSDSDWFAAEKETGTTNLAAKKDDAAVHLSDDDDDDSDDDDDDSDDDNDNDDDSDDDDNDNDDDSDDDDDSSSGSGVGILLGICGAAGLIGGLAYFHQKSKDQNEGGEKEDKKLYKTQVKKNASKKAMKQSLVPMDAVAEENEI